MSNIVWFAMVSHMFDEHYSPWDISQSRRDEYADSSRRSQAARKAADLRAALEPEVGLTATYDPSRDMPHLGGNGVKALSLFSGGGGLDLGFDLAGFEHVASFEVLKFAGDTLNKNRPDWHIASGKAGDVTQIDWRGMRGRVDFIHGGPPCQPYSIAGRRKGSADSRDMFPEFVRAVIEIQPQAFLIENVLGFLSKKFSDYREEIFAKLTDQYDMSTFTLSSAEFGVPQDRRRAFVVGWKRTSDLRFDPLAIPRCENRRGVREALGLPKTQFDGLAPTLRCTLTGPRQTTSVANSTASVETWTKLGIWPHGVSPDRSVASSFPTRNQTYRLCVEECQLLQGFPLNWEFVGAVYQRLGLIGNSVCPPVAYATAVSIFDQLFKDS